MFSMDKQLEKAAKKIIGEEFYPEPALRAARRLYKELGMTEDQVLALDVPDPIRNAIWRAYRDLKREG